MDRAIGPVGIVALLALLALPSALAAVDLQAIVDGATPGAEVALRDGETYLGPVSVAKPLSLRAEGTLARIETGREPPFIARVDVPGGRVTLDRLALKGASAGFDVASGLLELRGVTYDGGPTFARVADGAVLLYAPPPPPPGRVLPPLPDVEGSGLAILGWPQPMRATDERGRVLDGATFHLLGPDGLLATWAPGPDEVATPIVPTDAEKGGLSVPLEAFALRVDAPGRESRVIPRADVRGGDVWSVPLAAGGPPAPIGGPPMSATVAGRVAAGAALAAAALAGAAAIVLRDEARRFRFALLGVPLFTRLRRGSLLDQPTRERLHAYVLAHPGAHYREIRRALGLPNGVVAHHLAVLVKQGYLRSAREGQYLRFFPAGLPRASAIPVSTAERVLAHVRANPGATGSDVARALGASPSLVAYHVDGLEASGRLARSRSGREVRLYPLDGAPAAEEPG